MKILIVEDQVIHRELLEAIIGQWPEHEVVSVENGEAALIMLLQGGYRFDLVFLDVRMPGISGLEVLQQIRQSRQHVSLPIIMCTSATDRLTVTKAIQLGISHYLVKPCTEEAVARKLRQINSQPASDAN